MEASARFCTNRQYFSSSFNEWLASVSRLRRWQRQVGLLMLISGTILVVAGGATLSVGVALLFIAVIEISEFFWYRSRWINRRLAVRKSEGVVEMRFDDSGIHITGPTARGHVSWEGIRGARETTGGIFLRIEDGISMYVPKTSVVPIEAVATIVQLAARGT